LWRSRPGCVPGRLARKLFVQATGLSVGVGIQCECGWPVPHRPQALGCPLHGGAASPAELAAKVENFFTSFAEPQCGQCVPCHALDRTSTSLSRSHFSQ